MEALAREDETYLLRVVVFRRDEVHVLSLFANSMGYIEHLVSFAFPLDPQFLDLSELCTLC